MPIIIPFGADGVAPEQLSVRETDDGRQVECRLPHVIIDPSDDLALRLNSGGLEFGEPPPLPLMPEVADQLAYLLTHFKLYCTVWNKYPRLFLDRYFEFIRDQVAGNQAELTQSLAPFGDLYEFEQWAFSALRPLPRAHLWAPEDDTVTEFDSAGWIRVDFAFWGGAEIVAIDLIGSETRGASHARQSTRLAQHGIKVIEFPNAFLADAASNDFAASLPAEFLRFWDPGPLPSGPFRTTPLPDPT
jgi:hypothetical protein